MKQYDVFIFDADNTLYDYDMAEAAALRAMLGSCRIEYSEDIRARYREICKEDAEITRFSRFLAELGVSAINVRDFNDYFLKLLSSKSYLIDGALKICRDITAAGGRIYIATSGGAAAQARLAAGAVQKYISDVFIAEKIGFDMLHPEFFEHIFNQIQPAAKDKILMIGDNLALDIACGNNVGIDTCWLNRFGEKNTSGIVPTYEIRRLRQLADAIPKGGRA